MVKQYGAVPAKGIIPLQDKLRQSEEALAAAQKTIAEQQVREQELRKLLELNSLADGENSTANALLEAKTHALHNIHSQKVRALMNSIHQLQEQVATMKAQDKEHRRSALIQSLRKKQREQDLLVDVLKETLQAKVSEFQDDPNLLNEFILKKTISGPKRFRPKTREELELEFAELDKKYKRTLASLKKAKTSLEIPQTPRTQETEERTPAEPGPELVAMQKELETLRVAVAAKEITRQAQLDQIDGLRKRLEELHLVEDKLERTKTKYSASKEAIKKLQDDAIRLIQDKECESERWLQLEAELAFYKEATDTSQKNGDKVKMELMERVKALHAREAEHLTQLEDQQRKWAQDRTTILAQMRTQENHILSIEAQSKQAAEQATKLVAERDALKRELDKAKEIVDKMELEVTPREPATLPSSPTAKERALQEALDAKDEMVKALEKQIVAAKLLSRQQKKEKETLLVQMDKLRTLVASTAPPTDASRVIAQATTKQSTDATTIIDPESAAKDDAVDTSRAEPVE